MKYNEIVYEKFGSFFAKAIEICKEKTNDYNAIINKKKGHKRYLLITVRLLYAGWFFFTIVIALTSLGVIGFSAGIATLIASNPVLAAILAIGGLAGGGAAIKLIWTHRETGHALKTIGERYKPEFDKIINNKNTIEQKEKPIEKLLNQCIKSICTEIYQINFDKQNENFSNENK